MFEVDLTFVDLYQSSLKRNYFPLAIRKRVTKRNELSHYQKFLLQNLSGKMMDPMGGEKLVNGFL
jgi:hypothetical protein